jgi:hypothetical protein
VREALYRRPPIAMQRRLRPSGRESSSLVRNSRRRRCRTPSAVKKAVAGDPKMVGYIDRSDVDADVEIVLLLP